MTTQTEPSRRYWDSTNFICLIADDEKERSGICERILQDAEEGRTAFIITSALTMAEVVKKRGQPPFSTDVDRAIKDFFLHDYILAHDVTRSIAELARTLSRKHGLRPADAIHLATAIQSDADVFETWDMRDFGGIADVPIAIREPAWAGQLRLPGETGSE